MKLEQNTQLFQKLERARYLNRELDCWSGRKLQKILGYRDWRSFNKVIEKATITCVNAGYPLRNHFAKYRKMVMIGNGGRRKVEDVGLTRYACYLITQNANPAKNNIAFTQIYFSMQNRNLEIIEELLLDGDRCFAPTKSENRSSSIIYEQGADQEGFRLIRSLHDKAFPGGYSIEEMKKKWSGPLRDLLSGFRTALPIRAKDRTAESTSHNALVKELVREYKISIKQGGNYQRMREILIAHGLEPEGCRLMKMRGKRSPKWRLLTRKPLNE